MKRIEHLDCTENIEQPSLAHCTAVILAGGVGTRLRPVVQDRQKVMANIAGRPFLTYILDQIVGAGIKAVEGSILTFRDCGKNRSISFVHTNDVIDERVEGMTQFPPVRPCVERAAGVNEFVIILVR